MAQWRGWLTRRRLVALAVAAVFCVVAYWFSAYSRGMAAARLDSARGRSEVLSFGLPAGWDGEYRRLLRERYGVEVHAVAGCVVTEDEVWYVDGYNAVAVPQINARFGKDVFAECWADARASVGERDRRGD